MNNPIVKRGLLSLGALIVIGLINNLFVTMSPVALGDAAVLQLQNSNSAYLASQAVLNSYPSNGISILFLLLALVAIWWKYIKAGVAALLAVMVLTVMVATPSYAYYNTKDYPEYVEIGSNQSAFMVPVAGANKDTQAQFGSAEYLQSVKVAAKRIQIPHTLIRNPGWSYDYYVPAAKLYIVERTLYHRNWTGKGSGTNSDADESFHTDTADGANISFDIAIVASIAEEDTAKFLDHFGTKPSKAPVDASGGQTADDATNQAIFSSVAYGYSLAEVMDTVVHAAVQAEIAKNFGILRASEIESKKIDAIKAVEKVIREKFAANGITITSLGLASGINFDNAEIQKAMDDLVIADLKVNTAAKMQSTVPYQQAQAQIAIQNGLATAVTKWDGKLVTPSVMSNDSFTSIMAAVKSFFLVGGPISGPIK